MTARRAERSASWRRTGSADRDWLDGWRAVDLLLSGDAFGFIAIVVLLALMGLE